MRADLFQIIHILSSSLTLLVMLLAAAQALLLFYQDHLIRRANTASSDFSANLNLESMEKRLFKIIFLGFCLLTGIILSSFYFFYEKKSLFLMKLSFSFLAWCVFASLLWWRYRFGLRGRVAVFSTLVGVIILLGIGIKSIF